MRECHDDAGLGSLVSMVEADVPTRINHAIVIHILRTRRVYIRRLQNHGCPPRRRAMAVGSKRRAYCTPLFREFLREILARVTGKLAAFYMLHTDSTGLVDRWDCLSGFVKYRASIQSSVPGKSSPLTKHLSIEARERV